ncbi:thiamine pyrophosphate-binding protein [Bauldia litoralis]|uniref:Acetolactate synthase-1/2/3 large subunit n=1 Tax=Bauldia litoralis TaxID=665467 RepID=A0A1G6CTF2_9HYPH|nr:thiamine pyrophosphate-binding protein [Bauldia litoralis]SDB36168.1 acetolactate synthase-1/2/3 large subunit [Bauldia litoralis]
MTATRTGGQILADALLLNDVSRAFCVPGESYLALLDALYDSPIKVTTFRQEGGAAMAADAWGKMTGRPGIVMATRGPGATNASAGLHVARQDSTPMILLLGQVARHMREREAFQEINIKAFFGEVAKWVAEIDRAERIPEFISRAFHEATSGRPGPVVLGLPEDMLRDTVAVADTRPWVQVETYPGLTQMAQLQKMLWAAKRPLVILGGTRWSDNAVAGMRRFAERFDLPIACSFRRQALFDNDHRNYAGDFGLGFNPALAKQLKDADLLLLVGGRMSEMPSGGYGHIAIPEPDQRLVHVHPGAEELGRVYHPTLAIHASPAAFVAALEGLEPPPSGIAWAAQTRAAREAFEGWTAPVTNAGPVQLSEIIAWLRERLPDDATITNGAGNYSGWLHRFFRYRRFGTQLAPTSGSMGYGMPAAIAAKLAHPERIAVAFAGDGCFQMTSQEFATAVQEKAAIVVVVVNNGIHGTIRMHQERDYPNRHIATDLVDPDFAALARAYGGHGETVARTEDFAPAFEAALASGKPSIIDLKFDPEAITPSRTMSEIRGSGKR